ncbi:hypothetical protein MN116_005833 [Schistosoma mekongi]|uniref:Calponin-homology (CH) domain-containing protein n=1 Tax=Schistosoma mekongi TaxID=38744 RepID=A0AAE2D3S4_SCHME|nr:hypothetical protein MN116_005833 [Schistosoma mekongi]
MSCDYRAAKSGFALDVQQKLAEKFDGKEAAKTLRWIRQLSPPDIVIPETMNKAVEKIPKNIEDVNMDEYFDYLYNGLTLGYLMACLDPNFASKLNNSKTWQVSDKNVFETPRQRERISIFLKFAADLGVKSASLFQTDQLYEKTNLPQVIVCLSQVGIEAQAKPGFRGPRGFWIQKHKENKRDFTEEQLRSGETVIGLQAGFTGGATASGVNFGGRRHITDTF